MSVSNTIKYVTSQSLPQTTNLKMKSICSIINATLCDYLVYLCVTS